MRTSRRLTLPTTGLDYHLLEWGADQPALDHTVILLHGFLDLGWGWVPTVEAGLEGAFHLIAPDLRGHGDSDRIGPGGYYHFPDYLADLHDLVGQVGRRRVSLVGHSMGGSIAAYYAGSFPGRVARLALLEGLGPPEMTVFGPDRVVAWIEGWRRVRERGVSRGYASVEEAAARLRAHDPLLGEELARTLAEQGTRAGPDGRLHFKHDPLHATVGPYGYRVDLAESFWRRIGCKVLLVEGEASVFRYAPEDAARRLAAFRDLERVSLPGAGHMMQRHQPGPLARILADFLGRAP